MNVQEALAFIHGIERFGSRLGLERVRELLNRLGNPQERLRFVHVAGTNGKGSTSTIIATVLRQAGYRTGLYISPYVLEFAERIQVNGHMIGHDSLAALTGQVKTVWEEMRKEGNTPTEFEVVFAIALLYYAREGCDIVVLEVGLGGRLDATNVIDTPLVSVITAIGYDHTQYLGETLTAIAGEKAGIIKPNGVTVCYPRQEPEALAVIMERCAVMNNQLVIGSPNPDITSLSLGGAHFSYDGLELFLPLAGRHQVDNAINAIEAVKVVRQQGYAVRDRDIQKGMEQVSFPSRMEVLGESPLLLVDGAHNQSGMRALTEGLGLVPGREIHAIVGMLEDKDVQGSLALLAPLCKAVYAASPANVRAMKPRMLAEIAGRWCGSARWYKAPETAFEAAEAACPSDGLLLVCGSLYLTSALRPLAIASADKRLKSTANDR